MKTIHIRHTAGCAEKKIGACDYSGLPVVFSDYLCIVLSDFRFDVIHATVALP